MFTYSHTPLTYTRTYAHTYIHSHTHRDAYANAQERQPRTPIMHITQTYAHKHSGTHLEQFEGMR